MSSTHTATVTMKFPVVNEGVASPKTNGDEPQAATSFWCCCKPNKEKPLTEPLLDDDAASTGESKDAPTP